MRALGSAWVAASLALWLAVTPAWAQWGFDRPGGDYANALVRSGDPAVCAARCERDPRCRAWSFSYPTQTHPATCWLKNEIPARVENPCCVSSVKGVPPSEPRTPGLEFSIDRAGGDYRNLDVTPDPFGKSCAQACAADQRCRAWTYVRPGYYGPNARCYLKQRVTRPRKRPCCISGVVR